MWDQIVYLIYSWAKYEHMTLILFSKIFLFIIKKALVYNSHYFLSFIFFFFKGCKYLLDWKHSTWNFKNICFEILFKKLDIHWSRSNNHLEIIAKG